MENVNYKNEKIEQKKKKTLRSWLINYIPEPIRKILELSDYAKQTLYGRGKKLSKPKTQKRSEENILKRIKNTKKKN